MILETVKKHDLSYIDSIVHICEQNNIEIEDIKKYISPTIKDHLEGRNEFKFTTQR